MLLVAALPASAAEPKEGIDYELLPPPEEAPTGPVTVAYFFSHYCPTCAAQAESVDRWLAALPAGVESLKVVVPITGQAGKEPTNETYQALRQLEQLPQVERQLFAQLGRGTGSFADRESLLAWLAKTGVSTEQFDKAARSFSVAYQVKRANAYGRRVMASKRANIPVIMVDFRYVVTFSPLTPLVQRQATLDALVARSLAERAGAPAAQPR
jgi:thiol-disulfide isomerase/thioredoxin